MNEPGDVYDELATEQLARPGVTLGRALQNEVLKVNGKIFAFLNRDRLVVKLPRERAAARSTATAGASSWQTRAGTWAAAASGCRRYRA